MRQAILRESIAGVPGIIEDTVTALAVGGGQKRISRSDSQIKARLLGLFNKSIDDKMRLVEFENRIICTIKDVTWSPRHLKKIIEAMSDNQYFIVLVATLMDK